MTSIHRMAALAGACLVISGCAGMMPSQQRAPAPAPSAGGANADVVRALSDVQNLQVEVRELRDRVERQEFELERLRNRQRDLYDDLDQRLRAAERESTPSGSTTGSLAPSGTVPPTVGGESAGIIQGRTVPPQGEAGGAQVPTFGEPSSGDGAPASSGDIAIEQPAIDTAGAAGVATPPQPVSNDAQGAYDQAFSLLKQSRYNDAIEAFEAYIQDYPVNDLTDDAYYWLAEARYVTREFEAALNGFRTVTINFPESQRVPASYLKIGYIQYEIGAYEDARETLSYIMKNFPTHRVAVSAETRLKKMDREGR